MKEQPIERRTLNFLENGVEAGFINMWVEMYPKRGKKANEVEPILWDISSIPDQNFELRVIIWETRDVPNNDPEDMSDIYVRVALNSLSNDFVADTDTHIRASDGFVRNQANLYLFDIGQFQLANKIPYKN